MDMLSYLLGRNSGGGKGALKVQVVEELPETGEANILYLVPRQTSETNNVFDEYIWINNDYELIGTTEIEYEENINDIPIIYLTYNDNSQDTKNMLGEIITKRIGKGLFIVTHEGIQYQNSFDVDYLLFHTLASQTNLYEFYCKGIGNYENNNYNRVNVKGTWNNNVFTVSQVTYQRNSMFVNPNFALGVKNKLEFTPEYDYAPSTKYYVDALKYEAYGILPFKANTLYKVNDVVSAVYSSSDNYVVRFYKCIEEHTSVSRIWDETSKWEQVTEDLSTMILASQKYVDDLVGNINTVLATLTTPSNNGGN